jgi:hypothetical protein
MKPIIKGVTAPPMIPEHRIDGYLQNGHASTNKNREPGMTPN